MEALRIEVINGEELIDRVYTQAENADLFAERVDESKREWELGRRECRFRYLHASMIHDDALIVATVGERIVGMAQVGPNPHEESILWVKFVSVEKSKRGAGIARELIGGVYNYALAVHGKVEPSSFTELGQRLKHIFLEMDERYPAACSGQPHRDM